MCRDKGIEMQWVEIKGNRTPKRIANDASVPCLGSNVKEVLA